MAEHGLRTLNVSLTTRAHGFGSGPPGACDRRRQPLARLDRKPARHIDDGLVNGRFRLLRRSEEHTSELQSLMRISYAVFCLKKKKKKNNITNMTMIYKRE